jgi:uncharacterized protein (DUF302 family)
MYYYKKKVNLDFEKAVEKTIIELDKVGFGILNRADVKAALKKTINQDFDNYLILGACNPKYSFGMLQKEKDIGLLMPCNIVVYNDNNETFVSMLKPTSIFSLTNIDSKEIAEEVEELLKKAIDSV